MRDTHETKADVEKLKEKGRLLSAKVEALAFELERQRSESRHEYEKIAMQMHHMGETLKLRLENAGFNLATNCQLTTQNNFSQNPQLPGCPNPAATRYPI